MREQDPAISAHLADQPKPVVIAAQQVAIILIALHHTRQGTAIQHQRQWIIHQFRPHAIRGDGDALAQRVVAVAPVPLG